MKISFFIGIIAGIGTTLWLAFSAPFVAQDRVRSETRVRTNGGRLESFSVRLADDVVATLPGSLNVDTPVAPAEARWLAELAPFAGVANVYRLRNESGTVIGLASRVRGVVTEDDVEWVLHVPARGTLMLRGVSVDIADLGEISGGMREFAALAGNWEAQLDGETWRIDTVTLAGGDR